MAQKTFVNEVLTAADINTYLMGEGGAWTTWTPTVTQSGSVTVTNSRSRFARYGRTIHFTTFLTVTGSGTGANVIRISLPVTAAAGSEPAAGVGYVFDASVGGGTYYPGATFIATTTTFELYGTVGTQPILGAGGGFTAALAVGDVIRASGTYEAAA